MLIVPVIAMKLDGVLTFAFGCASGGVLVRLRASPRNCTFNLSVGENSRKIPRFMLKSWGPRSALSPILPKRAVVQEGVFAGQTTGTNAVVS